VIADKKGKLKVVKQRTVRHEGLRELIPWCADLLTNSLRLPAAVKDEVFRQAAHHRKQGYPGASLVKAPRQETPVVLADLATAAQLSLHPFHTIDESEGIVGESKAILRRWLWLLGHAGAQETDKAMELLEGDARVSQNDWEAAIRPITIHGWGAARLGWASCQGVGRGYPCGLWTILHAALANSQDAGGKILAVARDYIGSFFKCEDCAQHFVEAFSGVDLTKMDHQAAVLWLWNAHNSVNVRTAPQYGIAVGAGPFPSLSACPACRDAVGEWKMGEVYTFLQNNYVSVPGTHREL